MGGVEVGQASSILQIQVTVKKIIVDFLWLPAIKQKLVFLFPSLFMLMTIKGDLKKKKKKNRAAKEL